MEQHKRKGIYQNSLVNTPPPPRESRRKKRSSSIAAKAKADVIQKRVKEIKVTQVFIGNLANIKKNPPGRLWLDPPLTLIEDNGYYENTNIYSYNLSSQQFLFNKPKYFIFIIIQNP